MLLVLGPIPFLTVPRRLLGAKPEFQDLGMQILSLNSELATGVVWFHLNTVLLSGRSLSACTGAQGHCRDGMPRVEQEETEETETDFGIVLQR